MQITQINLVVTYRTIRQTEFHVGHPTLRIGHKVLVNHTPCYSNGREETPLVALSETGRTVSTECTGDVITSLVVIVRASEEGQHVIRRIHIVLNRRFLSQT